MEMYFLINGIERKQIIREINYDDFWTPYNENLIYHKVIMRYENIDNRNLKKIFKRIKKEN